MALHSTDPDRQQAVGWHAEGAGDGDGLHVREVMRIVGEVTYASDMKLALVVRLFEDFWITTIEPWED